jgi:hypothetical protein
MNATISILFYLKRAKANAQGLAPIFQRITINGKRLDNSTGKYVDPSKWSAEMSKMKGNSEEARLINAHLENLKTKILIAEKDLYKKDIPVNLESLKNILNGTQERQRFLIPIFQEHNNKIKELPALRSLLSSKK